MLSLDTETTGTDFFHAARPFLVTMSDEQGNQHTWGHNDSSEWPVNPITREPEIPIEDLAEIGSAIALANGVVLQNGKFDAHSLATIGVEFPWDDYHDTLLAGHLLASNQPHDLTSMALHYLGVDIQPLEERLERAVKKARDIARHQFPDWNIAREGSPSMPSAKEETWRFDYWLPRTMMLYWSVMDQPGISEDLRKYDEWWTVLSDYANTDSAVTTQLWLAMKDEMHRQGVWELYEESRKLPRIFYDMERRGITVSKAQLRETRRTFSQESQREGAVCVEIAAASGYRLDLPKSGMNNSLKHFCFTPEGNNNFLPVVARTEKGAPSFDAKRAIPEYLMTLDGEQLEFVRALAAKRKYDTALSYLRTYETYILPIGVEGWYVIHPSNNQTGTHTLRTSQENPNGQQISKQEDFTLRRCFGPAPGREWWSLDYQNIELRIPAYKAPEPAMIDLFERPDDPPYFGSNHLLVAHKLHPKLFEELVCPKCLGRGCYKDTGNDSHKIACNHEKVPLWSIKDGFKKRYGATWYQYLKNGNFAVQYGCQEELADRTYRVPGAFKMLKSAFANMAKLNDKCMAQANKMGYVETAPDRTVNPKRGYPLMIQRTEWGRVTPTQPLSYYVQGTAMWCSRKAMVRVAEYLELVNIARGGGYYMVLLVHDELVFDFPYAPDMGNLDVVTEIKRLMCMSGDDIGVPLGVGVELHPETWAKGISVKC